ncbi:putative nucleoredoxin 1-1 [Apium graveolens]|uniref:putative nucleoredoxin 1-1 n=1 Tax=Apium graveolens TaxID=4045 RepID=UPI003D7ABD7C
MLKLEMFWRDPNAEVWRRHFLNFDIAVYPFTRESAAKLEADKAKTLKLEMFWRDPNTLFRKKDGLNVRYSQLSGKRTIHLFGDGWFNNYVDFVRMLKSRYLQMKNTTNEFEVIYISYKVQGSLYKGHVAATRSLTSPPFALDSPWLTHPAFAYESDESKLLLSVFHFGRGLLAFDKDGRLLRRTICPFETKDVDFPFHYGSLESDAVVELVIRFRWGDIS